MYGDTDLMRKHVGRLREQGVDIRSVADHLVGQVDAVPWSGRAADALRERIRDRASQLRVAAAAHDTAAESLTQHVEVVERAMETIADLERRAAAHLSDDQLAALPAPGHRDWLSVDLPAGLSAGPSLSTRSVGNQPLTG